MKITNHFKIEKLIKDGTRGMNYSLTNISNSPKSKFNSVFSIYFVFFFRSIKRT